MTRYLRLLPIVLLCLSGTAQAGKKEELNDLRQRIADMQREFDKTSESKSEVVDALRESERAISNSKRKLAEIYEKQRATDTKLGELNTRAQRIRGTIADQQTAISKLLYQQYVGGQQEYLKLLLNDQNPNQLARDLTYYQYIARDRANRIDALRDNLAALDAISSATREQRTKLAVLRTDEAEQKRSLENEQRSRQQTLTKISSQLSKQRREIKRLQRNEARLARLVERLTKMLARSRPKALYRNDKLPDDSFDGSPFGRLKGKLILPVRGVITNQFGTPRPDSTVLWKGVFVRCTEGQPVKVIAAGRVVFADWLRGFGNLMIVDHGAGYMSLYGNNETLYKQVGDELNGGDTIAAVGNSGGNEESGLYFELRHKSNPLDPMTWMATK